MIYYIADTHFGHANIIKMDKRPFENTEEMEEALVENWNTVVKSGDIVYILGDFCWGKKDDWICILDRLKGQKALIQGNHDLKGYPPELSKKFVGIYDYKEVKYDGCTVILSHYPIMCYRHSNDPKTYMLHGHVHSTAEHDWIQKWTMELRQRYAFDKVYNPDRVHSSNCGQIYNVGCMMPWMDYTPRTLDEIKERFDYTYGE